MSDLATRARKAVEDLTADNFHTEAKVISDLLAAILAEREKCAAFAYAKHDWPARWIAASLRGENDGYRGFVPPAESK